MMSKNQQLSTGAAMLPDRIPVHSRAVKIGGFIPPRSRYTSALVNTTKEVHETAVA
ncbi:hypothetical protein [Massilia sp. AB1]|uniref:hypothetical protein n=1 Tax=Massilia sp. AB1 TaxID=2823371 RepID=UPI001B81B992|nr:hypothetical protein [Massilia sp. AB1]MBQ5942104.1 hypothetical protein [Massilia sp. AB1]